jgi:hypothetical protein
LKSDKYKHYNMQCHIVCRHKLRRTVQSPNINTCHTVQKYHKSAICPHSARAPHTEPVFIQPSLNPLKPYTITEEISSLTLSFLSQHAIYFVGAWPCLSPVDYEPVTPALIFIWVIYDPEDNWEEPGSHRTPK